MKSKSGVGKLFSFLGDVRHEAGKVAWPSRKEVVITTIIVFGLAVLASLFFTGVDSLVYTLVHWIIGS